MFTEMMSKQADKKIIDLCSMLDATEVDSDEYFKTFAAIKYRLDMCILLNAYPSWRVCLRIRKSCARGRPIRDQIYLNRKFIQGTIQGLLSPLHKN